MKIAQRMKHSEIDWTKFKYMVFDIPNHKGSYTERYEVLGKIWSSLLYWSAHKRKSQRIAYLLAARGSTVT